VKPAFLKEKKRTFKKALNYEIYHVGKIQPLTDELFEESKAKLDYLAQKDKERVMLEEAKNRVESYIYQIKNKLIDDEENIVKVTNEAQREELKKLSGDGEEWLYDEGYDADLATMEAKFTELSTPAEKVWFRMKEMTDRPAAVKDMLTKLVKVEGLLEKWGNSMPQVTDEEKDDVREKIEAIRKVISEKEAEQASKEVYEDPAYTSDEIPQESKALEKLISKLNKKPKPKPEKKNETDSGNETKSEEDDETKAEEGKESTEETADDSKSEEEVKTDTDEEEL
jgi:hypoxia up-regulated 1